MTQDIIVYVIGAALAAYVAVQLFRLVTRRQDPCGGCAGCPLKAELGQKMKDCKDWKPKK